MNPQTQSPVGLSSATGLKRETRPDDSAKNASSAASVNNPQKFQSRSGPSPLDIAFAIIPDIFALAKLVRWPIASSGPTFAWYRGNTDTPSLNISDAGDVWYDFALGKGGGIIDLISLVYNVDRKDACRRFIDFSVVVQEDMTSAERMQAYQRACQPRSPGDQTARILEEKRRREQEAETDRELWPQMIPFLPMSAADIEQLIKIRGWPAAAAVGLRYACDIGILFKAISRGRPTFVVTDSARLSAKERRLDGNDVLPGVKAMSLPGSSSRWPLGAANIRAGDHVILVEGETDQLAMLSLLAINEPAALPTVTVISLAAGTSIHEQAVAAIKDRATRVTVIADDDEAGRNATRRWVQQLAESDIPVRSLAIDGIVTGAKDISDLLRDSTTNPETSVRLRDWVGTITKSGSCKKQD